ncbi:MAG TPA: TonB-dependent receptor [Gemmatimonadales bacterium]|nr:TonB-dependent receptor [Gemmatimonadales bacterium]
MLLSVWLGLVAVPVPASPDTLAGQVVDTARHPLAGATVSLVELHRTTATDSSGRFSFADIGSGHFTLVVSQIGFAPAVRPIAVPAGSAIAIVLAPTAFDLAAVTVTATRAPADPMSSPLPTASLQSTALSREYRVSLAHALESLAGVRALTTGGEIGKPVIRGLSGARVLVLGDGNRLEDYSWSDEDGPSIETRLAERVEVIRGPASVLYGSDALGGVVNVIPEDVPDPRAPRAGPRGQFEVYGASNNHEFGSDLHAQGTAGGLGWLAGIVGRHSEALQTPAGELDNTGFTAFSGEGAVGARGTWGKATLRFTHYGGEFHLLEADTAQNPPAPPPGGGQDPGPVRKLTDDRVQLGVTHPAGGLLLEAKGQFQRHWLAEVVEGDTASTEKGFDLLLNTTSLDLLAHHGAGRRVAGTLGASAYFQNSATRGQEPLVPNAQASGAAAYAYEQVSLSDRWRLLAGARVDLRRLTADSNPDLAVSRARRDYTNWSGDIGLVFRPAERVAFSMNAGRAWRAPTLFELFTNGPHPGEARFEVGESTLEPEAGFNLDASIRWQSSHARVEVSAFRNRIARYIYIAPTGTDTLLPGMADALPVYRYQQADAVLLGSEASLEVAASTALVFSARVDYVRGERQSDQQPLPQIPPLRTKLGAEWRGVNANGGLDVDLIARQTRLSPFDLGTAGYGLLDLYGGLDRRFGSRPVRIELQLRNALNTRYRDFLSRYKAFALNPGRNVVVRLSTEL